MHINMKYYIVTIGAIFISLGIGILVGFNLNYDQELSKQQTQIIEDLDVKFEDLRTVNNELETNLKDLKSDYEKIIGFINENYEKLTSDQLLDKSIGIISIGSNNDSTQIEKSISNANGNVLFNINLHSNIVDENKIKEVSDKVGVEIKNAQELIDYISGCLNDVDGKSKLEYLEELDVIKINKLEDGYNNSTSVVLNSDTNAKDAKNQFEAVDKVLIQSLKSQGKYIVGVENSETKVSYIELYSENKISTIDNINEGSGQLSLVRVLKDGTTVGNFGIKETAESLIPYK
ncbi:MAG: copper transporter [Peptostreptococcaceae bacterium]